MLALQRQQLLAEMAFEQAEARYGDQLAALGLELISDDDPRQSIGSIALPPLDEAPPPQPVASPFRPVPPVIPTAPPRPTPVAPPTAPAASQAQGEALERIGAVRALLLLSGDPEAIRKGNDEYFARQGIRPTNGRAAWRNAEVAELLGRGPDPAAAIARAAATAALFANDEATIRKANTEFMARRGIFPD
jgi:hypothetical protein